MQRYPVLQSGFIAATETGLSRPDSETDIVADYVLNKTHLKSTNTYFFSKSITKLFTTYKDNNEVMSKFSFKEAVLSEAKKAFSFATGSSFQRWLQLQIGKETISDLHIHFLNETIKYIAGHQRELSIYQWFSLLEAKSTTIPSSLDIKEARTYLNNPDVLYSIETVIQAWVSKEGGFEDLLATLYVLFGERTAITTANYKHSG